MKNFLFLLMTFIGTQTFAQSFSIAAVDQPFYDIIEWKGKGGMLASKDPSGNSSQVTLTLIGDQESSIWDEPFSQRNEQFYFVASENTNYVYFLHNLQPEVGKIYLSQMNSGGQIKTTSINLTSAIKKLGYDVLNDELIDIVVTDKSLIHHFRHFDKDSKSYIDYATFTTHHNLLVYGAEIGRASEELIKDGKAHPWNIIGYQGENVLFAINEQYNKRNGWTVKSFTSKGALIESTFLNAPETEFINFKQVGMGTTGRYHLASKNDEYQDALLTTINGKYYLSGYVSVNGKLELHSYTLVEAEWKLVNKTEVLATVPKKGLELGVYAINEGLSYRVTINNKEWNYFLPFDSSDEITSNSFTTKTVYNPSRVLTSSKPGLFAINLSDDFLFFNLGQLGAKKDVQFERVKK